MVLFHVMHFVLFIRSYISRYLSFLGIGSEVDMLQVTQMFDFMWDFTADSEAVVSQVHSTRRDVRLSMEGGREPLNSDFPSSRTLFHCWGCI